MRQARTTDQTLADTLVLLPDGFASTHEPDDYLAARFRPWANEVAAIEASALALVGLCASGSRRAGLPR